MKHASYILIALFIFQSDLETSSNQLTTSTASSALTKSTTTNNSPMVLLTEFFGAETQYLRESMRKLTEMNNKILTELESEIQKRSALEKKLAAQQREIFYLQNRANYQDDRISSLEDDLNGMPARRNAYIDKTLKDTSAKLAAIETEIQIFRSLHDHGNQRPNISPTSTAAASKNANTSSPKPSAAAAAAIATLGS